MSRYIVLPTIDPRGIPSYYIVDTSDNSRARRYDCQAWAEHEARRMNGDREEERDRGFFRQIIEKLGGIYERTERTGNHDQLQP